MVERRMRADLLPVLGPRQVARIDAADVVEMAKAIDARGAHETARRSLEVTGQIFRYAVAHGLAPRNPAADVRPSDVLAPFKSQNFARVDLKELPALLKAMSQYHGAAETRLAMRLLAYTFVRTSELIEAPWSEIDFNNARWEIPAERMKMDKPHVIPLSRQAVDLFCALHQLTGHRALCFPGDRRHEQPMSNNTILKALERLGYAGRMTGHGWRGIASTILHENGFEDAHIELQLAHQKRDKVAAAYDYAKHLKARAAMMQWYADYLDSLATKSARAAVA
jgi:integrase